MVVRRGHHKTTTLARAAPSAASSSSSSSATTLQLQRDRQWRKDEAEFASDPEYQYLQRSDVPTDKFQRSLFRLPIPKLDQTLERYLASQRPLLSAERLEGTARLAKEFLSGTGARLDGELRRLDRANRHTSYIDAPWSELYLRDRRPVVFNHNPGIMMANDPRPEMGDTGLRVASVLVSSLRCFRSLRDGLLRPEVFHLRPAKTDNEDYWRKVRMMPGLLATPLSYLYNAYPLDMSQYKYLFQSTRIPLRDRDEIRRFPDSRHILILRGGHIYTFPVLDASWNLYPPSYYLRAVRQILQDSPPSPPAGIGLLTTEDRNAWASARRHLESLGDNAALLEEADSALYAICLDDHWVFQERDLISIDSVENLVYGHDPANRWFDKSFMLMFSANGGFGINFEHAWGDGVAVMRFVNEVVADSRDNDFVGLLGDGGRQEEGGEAPAGMIRRLEFAMDAAAEEAVSAARRRFEDTREAVEFDGFIQVGLGRDDCRRHRLSPDSIMQIAFQAAHHLVKGTFVPVYESCSTSAFRRGRTETLRSLTEESRRFVEAFNGEEDKDDRARLLSLLSAASAKHMDLTKLAAQGQGWDRHLFALKTVAEEAGGFGPVALFEDPAYAEINRSVISTSTLSSHNMIHGGFCPVVPEGFGFGYQIRGDMLGSYVSSYHRCSDMKEAFKETMLKFQKLLKD